MTRHCIVLLCLLLPLSAFAEIRLVKPISVSTEIVAWNSQILKEASNIRTLNSAGYTECAETTEIKNAYLCASLRQRDMNLALLRASFFVEGISSTPKNTIVPFSFGPFQEFLVRAGGHDLTSKDLNSFYLAMTKKCRMDSSLCPNAQEKEFFTQFFLPTYERNHDFVVVTYAVKSNMTYESVITHEIMHAYYFLQPEYRSAVDQFWLETVSDEEKQEIREKLSSIYDSSNEFLMKNEFQAYILEADAEDGQLAGFVREFRNPLMKAVHQIGVDPVQVK